jgi:hypothetical protein
MVDNDSYDFPSKLELMQYTGLLDKNGVEIYEGDICMHHYFHEKGVIEWINASFKLCYDDGDHETLLPIDLEHYEVIGNVYENPELLKENSNGSH